MDEYGVGAKSHLARRMRVWRAQWELTQQEAADIARVSLRTWRRWEKAETHVTYREWQRLMSMMEEAPPSHRPPLAEWLR